jgi:hypothetical protein
MEDLPPLLDTKPRLLRALVRVGIVSSQSSEEVDPNVSSGPVLAADSHNRPLHLVMSTLLTTFGVPVTRIDRRPSLSDIPFEDVYFVELEELGSPQEVPPRQERINAWTSKVTAGAKRVTAAGGEAKVLGVW